MKTAVVGATGLVGTVMLKILEERAFPVSQLIPVASSRSVGKTIKFRGEDIKVVSMEEAIALRPDFALFSAGGNTSKEYAPQFAEVGCCVIDNSSAWRMNPNVKLVVPEVNGDTIVGTEKIIANPNCSTIQMVTALNEIHKTYTIKRLVISTYQSLTGTGKKAVDQYDVERNGATSGEYPMAYPHPIDENCIPHCDVFTENGYTKEEMKLVHETRKIMNAPMMAITATAVRVPVLGGHSESLNVELANEFDLKDVIRLFKATDGVIVEDDIHNNLYPMPLTAKDRDEVKVGRIRLDESQPNTFNCWVVADNLRKGAATNAVQIAEKMLTIWKKTPVAND
jgi:aspartate-semialdehyde dehydrogenase